MAPYTLYTWGTPNGWKAHLILEELGLDYKVEGVDIMSGRQKEDWFLKINPNGRIPAIVDHEAEDLGVFETGSIMWYLVQKHDKEHKFWPKDFSQQSKVMSWLMFQMGGLGPMQGQANMFVRYAPQRIYYGVKRYTGETDRLYSVLESQLEKTEWLAGDSYTIADMASWCWVILGPYSGVDYKKYPNLTKWVQKIYARPAAKRALEIPTKSFLLEPLGLDDDAKYAETLAETMGKIEEAKKIADETAAK